MESEPLPLPVTLTVGDAGDIVLGDLLVTLDVGALLMGEGVAAAVTVRAVDGRSVVDNLADLLDATAARLRTGELTLDDDQADDDRGEVTTDAAARS